MTIIVYKDGVMASDSQISSNDWHYGWSEKTARNLRGDLLGASGDQGFMVRMLQWFLAGEKTSPPSARDGDKHYDCMIVRSKSQQILTLSDTTFCPLENASHAIGSGRTFALGAMEHGASAVDAVKTAIKFDLYCGGEIRALPHKGKEVRIK